MSGIFNPLIFNNSIFNTGIPGEVLDIIKTGTGGIDPGEAGTKRRSIVKPLGTLGLKKDKKSKVQARIEDSRAIQAEVASKLAKQFSEETVAIKPIAKMTMAEVEFEIGTILRKQIRTKDDEAVLILLMIAAL